MISIAMATYNGEKYLQEQLDSFVAQTVLPDELVVCDDCSKDRTIEILEAFKAKVNFEVRIIRNEINSGYAKNFARVIGEAKGDYVFLSDQDDVWYPNKIETVLNAFKEKPDAQLVAHNARCVDAELRPMGMTLFDCDRIHGLRYGSAIHGFVTCLKRSYLNYMLPIPYCYTHDRWLSLPASELKIRYELDTVLCDYRRHENAVTFDYIGAKENLFQVIKDKWKGLTESVKRARSLEEIDYRYTRESSIAEFSKKVRGSKEFPVWINKDTLDELEKKANIKLEAFRIRYDAISVKGFKRLKRVVKAFYAGVYKNFHGIQTALDDLFRFTGDAVGTPEERTK
mgnify:CR=1 FL=1